VCVYGITCYIDQSHEVVRCLQCIVPRYICTIYWYYKRNLYLADITECCHHFCPAFGIKSYAVVALTLLVGLQEGHLFLL